MTDQVYAGRLSTYYHLKFSFMGREEFAIQAVTLVLLVLDDAPLISLSLMCTHVIWLETADAAFLS